MIGRVVAIGCALLVATPLAAQVSSAPTAAAPSLFPPPPPLPDPSRVAAARPVIDAIWPMGTYARLMHATMDQMAQGMIGRMFGMTPDQLTSSLGLPADKKLPAGQTLGQSAEKGDPAIRERMRITMTVMGDEMAKLMTEIEPQVREALVASYARRFSVTQLDDLQRFFATPTGKAYANDSMMLMMGPDMMSAMQSFLPEMMQRMPAMMARVEEATKHLPPPPSKAATARSRKVAPK